MKFDVHGKRVYVAGHRGMVGSALVRRLAREDCQILTVSRGEVDLRNQQAVDRWFDEHRPDVVFLAAARVGGIYANNAQPGDFLYDNLALQTNLIEAARRVQVAKLLFFGSSCIYPRLAPQPMPESCLLTGSLEPTNQWYAIAKIAGLKLCEAYRRQYGCDFISVMPTNLYGPGDNFDPLTSHVLAALIVKIDDAVRCGHDRVVIWGTGTPRREFLHVDDLADAAVFLIKNWSSDEHINIARIIGFEGNFVFDPSKPDGTPRKLLDVAKLNALGWRYRTDLESGIRQTYDWYRREKVLPAA